MKKFLALALCLFLASCGGGGDSTDPKGGSTIVETVRIMPPTFDRVVVYSDVAVWQDRNSDGKVCDYVNDAYSMQVDTVNMTVSVEKIKGLPENFQVSPVRLESIEVKYTPADTISPAFPNQYYNLSAVISIPAGQDSASYVSQIEVLPLNLKMLLQQRLICTDTVYKYYVTVTVKAVEILTGKKSEIQGHFTLTVGDLPETSE